MDMLYHHFMPPYAVPEVIVRNIGGQEMDRFILPIFLGIYGRGLILSTLERTFEGADSLIECHAINWRCIECISDPLNRDFKVPGGAFQCLLVPSNKYYLACSFKQEAMGYSEPNAS